MNACSDFIQFDRSEDWELAVSRLKTAQTLSENAHVPIAAFDLGIEISEPYVVAVVEVFEGKPTWTFAGKLWQTWNFAGDASSGASFGRAQSKPTNLLIDEPRAIFLNRNTVNSFRFRYSPPYWFKGLRITVWKYVGTVENFTKDTLFEIGNKLGTGTLDEPTSIPNLLANQQTALQSILDRLADLESNFTGPIANSSLASEDIARIDRLLTDNTDRVNQRIDSFSNDLSDVLSGNEDADILANNNQPTNVIDEFI